VAGYRFNNINGRMSGGAAICKKIVENRIKKD